MIRENGIWPVIQSWCQIEMLLNLYVRMLFFVEIPPNKAISNPHYLWCPAAPTLDLVSKLGADELDRLLLEVY